MQRHQKQFQVLLKWMIKILHCLEITYGDLKTFFSTFIPGYIQTFIVQLNNVVLTLKARFTLFIRTIKIKKRQEHLRKKPQNFNLERQNTFEKEQKPLRIDDLNSNEEKRVKRKATKEKEKGVSKLKKTR